MKSPSIPLQIFLYLSLLISGCSESESDLAATHSNRSDNQPRLALTKIDSIGIEIGDSNYVFGNIIDAAFMPDGRIVLLDVLKDRISVFSQSGEYLASTGSEGQGPGEFMEPASIAVLSNGDICVADFMSRKLIFFDSDLNYKREISGFSMQPPSIIGDGHNRSIVGLQTHYYFEDENLFIGSRLAMWTNSSDPGIIYEYRYNQHNGDGPVTIPYFAFATGSNGSVYCAESSKSEYRIMKYTPEGDTAFTITESYSRMHRTEEELSSAHFGYVLDTPGFDSNDRKAIRDRWEVDPVRNAISSIHVDGHERLWVRTGRGESPSPMFEVYDSTGTHLCSISTDLPAQMRWACCKMVFGNDRILVFDNNPADFSKIIIFEIDDLNN
ncbi:MAG: 6-bladed beta-propeller [Candidatus Aegiribacteria sp.]|nr:6-bladed beta-propeller [Candidatus Aegiribacteria sp.]